jgi:hypothetical protein
MSFLPIQRHNGELLTRILPPRSSMVPTTFPRRSSLQYHGKLVAVVIERAPLGLFLRVQDEDTLLGYTERLVGKFGKVLFP